MPPLFDERRKDLMISVMPALNRFLAARERSTGEVIEFIKKKQLCFAEDYDMVLAMLADDGLVDDHRFVRNRIEHRLNDGYGPAYIRNDLIKFSVAREIVTEVFGEFPEEDYLEAARVAVQKKERSALAKDDPARTLRNALQYRGFKYRQIEVVVAEWTEELESEDEDKEYEQ